MRKHRSSTIVGDRFEAEVRGYYEALGYDVKRNISLENHQIDLLATRDVPGAGRFRLMVEAKARKGRLGINDVGSFIAAAQHLLAVGQIHGAIIVTNGTISAAAAGAIYRCPSLRCATINDLKRNLVDYSESLHRIKIGYESRQIAKSYIPLRATITGGRRIGDVAREILDWSAASNELLVLSGDFGSGKSTVLERVCYEQACRKLLADSEHFPVLLNLRNLLRYDDLSHFVEGALREAQSISGPQFAADLATGRLLVLLDGFDEINPAAGAADRARYLKTLSPIIGSTSPCVLTTRPTYFDSFDEMKRELGKMLLKLPAFERLPQGDAALERLAAEMGLATTEQISNADLRHFITLSPLNDQEIDTFLRRFETRLHAATGMTVAEIKGFLERIYDLQDLMQRPLLLQMIVTTLLEGALDISNPKTVHGPSSLYEAYTQLCLRRDFRKLSSPSQLAYEDRQAACRVIAWRMFERNRRDITAAELAEVLDDLLIQGEAQVAVGERQALLERAATELRLATFLTTFEGGMLKFAHKSYYEFFLAQEIMLRSHKFPPPLESLGDRELEGEVVYFLGSYARTEEDFRKRIVFGLRTSHKLAPQVAALYRRIAFASGVALEGQVLTEVTIEQVVLPRSEIRAVTLDSVELRSLSIKDVIATNWVVRGSTVRDCDIINSTFHDFEWRGAFPATTFRSCSFTRGQIEVQDKDWRFTNGTWTDVTAALNGSGRLENVEIEAATITLGDQLELHPGSSAILRRCAIFQDTGSGASQALTFRRCKLLGVSATGKTILSQAGPHQPRGTDLPVTFDVNCEGVVLVQDPDGRVTPELVEAFQQRFGKLILIHSDWIAARNASQGAGSWDSVRGATLRSAQISRAKAYLARHDSGGRAAFALRHVLG